MKFKSTVNEIKKAIQVLSPVINYNHQTLAFRYILIRKNGNKIELKGYDDFTVGSAFFNYFEIEEEKNESIYILAKHFINLIDSFSNNDINIQILKDKCIVLCGKSKYVLPVLDEKVAKESLDPIEIDYYNIFKSVPKEQISSFKIDEFKTCYSSVNHCLSKDKTQRNLQNIHLSEGKMLACDGTRGAIINFEYTGSAMLMLHKKICDCLLNISNFTDVYLYYCDNILYVSTENFIFASTVEEDYPYKDIKILIDKFNPEKASIKLFFDPDEIKNKLNRVLIFSDTDTNSVGVKVEKDELILFVDNNNSASEVVNIFKNETKKDFSLYIDGKLLSDALSKSLSETSWTTQDSEDVQFIYDGSLLQFFLGLTS